MARSQGILLTGSGGGFGRLTAITLARRGHRVVATMRDPGGRNVAAASELVALAEVEGLVLRVVDLDVAEPASIEVAVPTAIAAVGGLDVLVNNAGLSYEGLLETVSPEQTRAQFEVNVFGPLALDRAVLPHMRARGSGLLLHVSSGLGRVVRPGMGTYCASKFALEALAETYRYELAHLGVDSVLVEPGIYPTGFFAAAVRGTDAARGRGYAEWARELPGPPRKGGRDPQEVADAIADLVEMPAGTRPLRTRVGGPEAAGPERINEVAAEVQAGMLARSGLTELTALPPAVEEVGP